MADTNKPEWKSVAGAKPPTRRSLRETDASSTANAGGSSKSGGKKGKKRTSWPKRIALWLFILFLTLIVAGCAAFLILYARTKVPAPDEFALAQASTVYYNDGQTELGTFAEVDRTIIDTSTLPAYVGNAIVASEDRTFYSNSGIDIKGILRALVNNATGGARQGASTISQGYVENYYLGADKEKSYFRKLDEAIIALKLNRSQPKDEILGNYMNTIFFGRGAYGIQAAAEAYFNKDAKDLTLSEAALLAGILPAPSAWDPAVDPDMAEERWQRVLNLMVEDGWISQSDADAAVFPETIEPGSTTPDTTGANPYLMQQVRDELVSKGALDGEEIDAGGLTIITTLDKSMQDAAMNAVKVMPEDTPANVRVAMSAIDNATGEIRAEYPGADYENNQMNAVTQDIVQAGSTFKPFGLLAYMEQDGSIYDTFNGNSPMDVDGTEVANNDDASFGYINLIDATMYSVNTVFVELNQEVTPDKTLDALIRAGIPEDTQGLENNILNVLGSAAPHNIDLATAYATFANGGERVSPHIIREVKNAAGESIYTADTSRTREFSAEVVSGAMPGLQAVTSEEGTGSKVSSLGRDMGGKTGTSDEQKSAQFVGFIPQITTAVSMYAVGEDGSSLPLPNIGGLDQFHGGDWPTDVWLAFMEQATVNMENQSFTWLVQPKQPTKPAPAPDTSEQEELARQQKELEEQQRLEQERLQREEEARRQQEEADRKRDEEENNKPPVTEPPMSGSLDSTND